MGSCPTAAFPVFHVGSGLGGELYTLPAYKFQPINEWVDRKDTEWDESVNR